MSNYFNIMNVGLKGLQAQKKSLDTTGHNIANANTEGYSRQRAVHRTTDPYTRPGMTMPGEAGQMGTGVKIEKIERIRDQFIDGQIQKKKQSQGFWEKRYDGLHRIEKIFNEPSENSLDSAMTSFWESLEDLNNNPEDTAVRTTVRERANTLADAFHSLDDQLQDYKKSLNRDVDTTVDEINATADRIADLNEQIVHIKGSGQQPNDLMDDRDRLLEKLNQLVNVQSSVDDRGSLKVSLGGMSLVAGDNANHLDTESSGKADYQDRVVFEETGNKALIDEQGGELAGLINIRDQEITKYRNDLDTMAKGFVDRFNDVHREGYDLNGEQGQEFFAELTEKEGAAGRIAVSDNIEDVNRIAAGRFDEVYSGDSEVVTAAVTDEDNLEPNTYYNIDVDETNDQITVTDASGNPIEDEDGNLVEDRDLSNYQDPGDSFPDDEITLDLNSEIGLELTVKDYGQTTVDTLVPSGNGNNARQLARVIKEDKLFNEGSATVEDKYESVISTLGVDGQRADQMVDNQDTLVDQLENQRQSISGVSLDEEMANMIKYQQAYNASAKVISNANQMLDSLMNMIR